MISSKSSISSDKFEDFSVTKKSYPNLLTEFLASPSGPISTLNLCTRPKTLSFQPSHHAKKIYMFIAIGSKHTLLSRRQEIRRTWLNWLPKDGSIKYAFFTDQGNDPVALANAGNKQKRFDI
jgi:hypothetical protein